MSRPRHPNKDIEEAIQYAEANGWRYQASGKSSHAWGRLLCPESSREGCQFSVWSTPRNTTNHARQIRRHVDNCLHEEESES